MIPTEDEQPDQPGRPSVEEKIADYWDPTGASYQRGLAEAKDLLDCGAPVEEAAEWVGWSVAQLLRALPAEYSTACSKETAA